MMRRKHWLINDNMLEDNCNMLDICNPDFSININTITQRIEKIDILSFYIFIVVVWTC